MTGGYRWIGMGVREHLNRPVTPLDVALAVVAVVAGVLMSSPGLTRWIGLTLLVLVAVRIALAGRVARRRWPARVATVQEAALLPWDCETVWNLIKPAEKAPLLDPTVQRAYQVPGTPSGLGERQAHERHDGSVAVIEVVEYLHHRRAAFRQVSPPVAPPTLYVQQAEPTDGGCVYTWAVQVEIPAGIRLNPAFEAAWRENAREQIRRIREVLAVAGPARTGTDAAWPPPAPT